MTRTCTVPGCQSRHHSHGFCSLHRHRWQKHGDATAVQERAVTPRHLAEMVDLAEEDLSRTDIAAITGFSVQTVGKRVGHLVPSRNRSAKPDVARYRRMLLAVASAEYGTRDEIARRFGLKNRFSLKTTLVTARRRVCAASRCGEKGSNSHGAS